MNSAIHSLNYSIEYLKELVADLSNDDMVAQADGMKNHAAWVIGHLAFGCQAMAVQLGVDRWLPDDWGKRFGMGSAPVSDVDCYESKEELLQILDQSADTVAQAIHQLPALKLDDPLPDKNYHDDLPTIRHAIDQILMGIYHTRIISQ